MHDIRNVIDYPTAFDAGLKRRGIEAASEPIIEHDVMRRNAISIAQGIKEKRNKLAKEIGRAKSSGEDTTELENQSSRLRTEQSLYDASAESETKMRDEWLMNLPNIPDDEVTDGVDENNNVVIKEWGAPRIFDFTPKDHADLGEDLGMMDFENAAKMSGSRFVILSGPLAKLERAISNFMLDLQVEINGYTEINPPVLVRTEALQNTGQLPKFAEDLYQTDDNLWMIPTAEVPLTNIVSGEILKESDLPKRYVALTPCFRAEAGSAGKDVRGMIRQHQFNKVEMVAIVKPEDSDDELLRMTKCAELVLERLDIPYRTVELCVGDLGFSAAKTFDIEVWLPSQNTYREISSCSNTRDFQARRMNARFRREGEKKPEFVNTLNGSGLAVGRCLVAVMENYQTEDGTIVVPEVLRPYMNNQEIIHAGNNT